MRLVLVSGNAHKVRELGAALPGWEVLGWDGPELPPETGTTFLANARGKAEFGRSTGDPEAWVAGEDSGIEVDGLGGAPGVYSARYAGEGASDEENLAKLLCDVPEDGDRRVAYVCALAYVEPGGREEVVHGRCEGELAAEPRGDGMLKPVVGFRG